MVEGPVWDKESPVPPELIQYVDQGVVEKLPPGTHIHAIEPSGSSYWARTAKIEASDADGNPTPFFIKVHQFAHGKDMVRSEFHAMSLLYRVMPEMVAEPLAWGEYKEAKEVYFFVCRFHEFSDEVPRVNVFPKLVAEFHKRSKFPGPAQSKTGEFGFDMTTYGGRNPQNFPLSTTWEECFTKGLGKLFDLEAETHKGEEGSEDMQRLRKGIVDKVIPRLLRPLETEGRTLTPTLVHGDLWDGNASVDSTTAQPMFFDATPMWAHNEYELAPWWLLRHEMTDAYIEEYKRHYDPSEPSEDFESRGALYALRFDLLSSSLYPGNLRFRKLAIATMENLLSKFPLGYEGYASEKGLAVGADAVKSNAEAFGTNADIAAGGKQVWAVTGEAGLKDEKVDRTHGEEWQTAKQGDGAKVQV